MSNAFSYNQNAEFFVEYVSPKPLSRLFFPPTLCVKDTVAWFLQDFEGFDVLAMITHEGRLFKIFPLYITTTKQLTKRSMFPQRTSFSYSLWRRTFIPQYPLESETIHFELFNTNADDKPADLYNIAKSTQQIASFYKFYEITDPFTTYLHPKSCVNTSFKAFLNVWKIVGFKHHQEQKLEKLSSPEQPHETLMSRIVLRPKTVLVNEIILFFSAYIRESSTIWIHHNNWSGWNASLYFHKLFVRRFFFNSAKSKLLQCVLHLRNTKTVDLNNAVEEWARLKN